MPLENIIERTADISLLDWQPEPVVMMNDDITFVYTVQKDGNAFPLTNVSTATLACTRRDGKTIVNVGNIDADAGTISFEIGRKETAVEGRTQLVIQLYDIEQNRVSTIRESMYVQLDPTGATYEPLTEEKTLIEQTLFEIPVLIEASQTATIGATQATNELNDALLASENKIDEMESLKVSIEAVKTDTLTVKEATEQATADTLAMKNTTEAVKNATDAVKIATEIVKNEVLQVKNEVLQVKNDTLVAKTATETATANANTKVAELEQVKADNVIVNLSPVDTIALRNSTYPNPTHGSVVNVLTGASGLAETYRFETGTGWKLIDKQNATTISNLSQQLADNVKKQKKMWIDVVEDYQADPTGVQDSTSAIQNALNSVFSNIFIPDGTYLINAVTNSNDNPTTGGLKIPSNKRVYLSKNATLKSISSSSQRYAIIRIQDADNVTVEGGSVKGDRLTHTDNGGEWGYGIIINGSTNITINDVSITDCWGDGIFINSGISNTLTPSKNIQVIKTKFQNNRRQGISVQSVDGLVVTRCQFLDTQGTAPSAGIDLEAFSDSYYVQNVKISENSFINNADGIQVNPRSKQIAIIGNTFEANRGRGISVYNTNNVTIVGNILKNHANEAAISITSSFGSSIQGNVCIANKQAIAFAGGSENNTVTGNVCREHTDVAILIAGSKRNIITNNICINNVSFGIYVFAAERNTIANNLTKGNSRGIQLSGSSHYCDISSNRITNNLKEGIRLEGCNHVSISNNQLLENSQTTNNVYDNIFLFNSDYATVQQNTVRSGETVNKPRFAIRIDDIGCNNIMLTSNDCYDGGVTGGIIDNGTLTYKSMNRDKSGSIV
ncbi:right-handed parallel beta-helix repeat-containing protein [Paenisporosarcina sp. NPDC076898]|uniref:right-handed parallel beta-helix repeat-containing protein n=1 Tax=unclassified Paenisporosarcina TaxID=2642018 RepID=UPI003D028DB0